MICDKCRPLEQDVKVLHPSTVYTMQYIVSAPVERLYTFTVSADVRKDLEAVMDQYLKLHIDRKFKTLDMLELIGEKT